MENATGEGTASSNSETSSNSGDAFESASISDDSALTKEKISTSESKFNEDDEPHITLVSDVDIRHKQPSDTLEKSKNSVQTEDFVKVMNEPETHIANVDETENRDEDVYENIEYSAEGSDLYEKCWYCGRNTRKDLQKNLSQYLWLT